MLSLQSRHFRHHPLTALTNSWHGYTMFRSSAVPEINCTNQIYCNIGREVEGGEVDGGVWVLSAPPAVHPQRHDGILGETCLDKIDWSRLA